MAVLLHPNKVNPERYRVWDRETKTQKYFPYTPEGLAEAEKYEEEVVRKRKKARQLQRELPMNRLFNDDGSVKGMSRKRRIYKRGYDSDYLSVYGNLKQTEFYIGKRNFEDTYKLACQWMLEAHGIEENSEIRRAFKKAKKHYWTSPKEEQDSMPFWKQYFG